MTEQMGLYHNSQVTAELQIGFAELKVQPNATTCNTGVWRWAEFAIPLKITLMRQPLRALRLCVVV